MFQKELRYQMVEHFMLIIREYLEENCHLILLCVVLMRKELRQEVKDVDKEIARGPLVKSLAKKGIEYAPGIYNLTKQVKNKTLSRILNSDAADLPLNKAIKTANNHLQ